MFADCLVGEFVKTASGNIGLELPIPVLCIECQKPFAELRKLLRAQVRNSLFESFECHATIVLHRSRLFNERHVGRRSLQLATKKGSLPFLIENPKLDASSRS